MMATSCAHAGEPLRSGIVLKSFDREFTASAERRGRSAKLVREECGHAERTACIFAGGRTVTIFAAASTLDEEIAGFELEHTPSEGDGPGVSVEDAVRIMIDVFEPLRSLLRKQAFVERLLVGLKQPGELVRVDGTLVGNGLNVQRHNRIGVSVGRKQKP
jgi:hypothetical protein